ncbi:PAP-specific phosphatase HAL2-like protein, partial [Cucurbita argyrosperma subsp. sororia]
MENGEYSKELDMAVRVVHLACALCRRVQEGLLLVGNDLVKAKDDDSPVTIADWSVQAIVSWILSEYFGSQNVSIVAEEDVQTLSKPDSSSLLSAVVKTVNECLAEAPKYGLQSPARALKTSEILEAISRCNSTGGPTGRHWVLDPVDGTLGFVRGDQYAVALALIENGCVIYAKRNCSGAWMQPLVHGSKKLEWPNSASLIQVSSIDDPALATFCEPVEKQNSNHSFTAGLAHSVGLREQPPLRVYKHGKYAMLPIARGATRRIFKEVCKDRIPGKDMGWDWALGFAGCVIIVRKAAEGVGLTAEVVPCPLALDFSGGVYFGRRGSLSDGLDDRLPASGERSGGPIIVVLREGGSH